MTRPTDSPSVQSLWIVYICLVLLRVICAVVPLGGYIHPDEHFQSTEPMAQDIFGVQALRTWDWTGDMSSSGGGPIRNVFSPFTLAGVPFHVLKNIGWHTNAYTVLVAPRIWCTGSSFAIDYVIYKYLSTPTKHYTTLLGLSLWASSYVVFAYLSRPYSNQTESVLFAMVLYLCGKAPLSLKNTIATGLLTGIGICVRPTFVAFACIPALWWLSRMLHIPQARSTKSVKTEGPQHCVSFSLAKVLIWSGCAAVCVGVGVFTSVILDSMYYGTLCPEHIWTVYQDILQKGFWPMDLQVPASNLTWTAYNNLRYNLNKDNLALHGLHWRGTHVSVNLPLLFGPFAVLFYIEALRTVKLRFISSNQVKAERETTGHTELLPDDITWLLSSIALPLTIFSMNPHQEARFLVPLSAPMVLLMTRTVPGRWFQYAVSLWGVFNVALFVLFTVSHQGGVIPSLIYLQKHHLSLPINDKCIQGTQIPASSEACKSHPQQVCSTYVVFHRTYMPPRHLLLLPANDRVDVCVLDLKGNENDERDMVLSVLLGRSTTERIYFLLPASVPYTPLPNCYKLTSFGPHFSGENLPDTALSVPIHQQFWLNMYLCDKTRTETEERVENSGRVEL